MVYHADKAGSSHSRQPRLCYSGEHEASVCLPGSRLCGVPPEALLQVRTCYCCDLVMRADRIIACPVYLVYLLRHYCR